MTIRNEKNGGNDATPYAVVTGTTTTTPSSSTLPPAENPDMNTIPVAVATVVTPVEPVMAVSTGKPPQPPAGAHNSNPTTATTTTTTTTRIINLPQNLGNHSANVKCPYCHKQCQTRTKEEVTGCTIAAVIILVFCFWPLFWVPLVCRDCKRTVHYCSSCQREVGANEPCT